MDREKYSSAIVAIEGELVSFNRDMETEFLNIGTGLSDMTKISREVSIMSLEVSDIMGGEEFRFSLTGIKDMVDNLKELLEGADIQTGNNIDVLNETTRGLHTVRQNLEELLDTSKNLRMLGLSTKIQSTRMIRDLGTFMQLGKEISDLSNIISSKAGDLKSEAGSLAFFVHDVLENLGGLSTKQREHTSAILTDAARVTTFLTDLCGKSSREGKQITSLSEEITKEIEEVVISVQYQDITRQSLEGVTRELGVFMKGVTSGDQTAPAGADCQWMMEAAAQFLAKSETLKETNHLIEDAAITLKNSLRQISAKILDMCRITAAACENSNRFLHELERGIHSITSYLKEVVKSTREMSKAMSSIADTVESMTGFTGEIENISGDIELIALNARIKAAQTGAEGVGMGVVAEAIQNTANESNTQRESLLKKLAEINQSSETMKSDIEKKVKEEEAKLEQMVRELGVLLDSLRILQKQVVRFLSEIDVKGKKLSTDIEKSMKEIRIHEKGRSLIGRAVTELERLSFGLISTIPAAELERLTDGETSADEIIQFSRKELMDLLKKHIDTFIKHEVSKKEHEPGKIGTSGDVELF